MSLPNSSFLLASISELMKEALFEGVDRVILPDVSFFDVKTFFSRLTEEWKINSGDIQVVMKAWLDPHCLNQYQI
ncbi:Hypothetical protein FKW44_003158 [Caligus rogercresseyi]|uniref:Uncharacterized protein n=1 Tax=Caligus rogercresseyi TaxID=217165 RepID=A0A7T8KL90_CALRO|nr:Hypothetical protein FKW44_003158 [Caligus rogercresseyi]